MGWFSRLRERRRAREGGNGGADARRPRDPRRGVLPDFLRNPRARRISVEDASEEGLMLAEYAAVMSTKNLIIEAVIRDGRDWDPDAYLDDARSVLDGLIDESEESAEHVRAEQRAAASVRGRASHQHDYHARDLGNLEVREAVNEYVARRLRAWTRDEDRLRRLVDRARASAWGEIAAEIEATLDRTWPAEPELDANYGAEREERMWMVRYFDLIELSMQTQSGGAAAD
ncbi:hypothetical protein [Agromyces archimandritae]|uniref:Uncharacterized protein n=1 Tax=Agromyces archimandritae TaxID=2781962 RepID=A0A975FP35_9MICO|nr:hypothetical protein [Agromyces archimandritae]QTX05694.1 hypothetical protein G127AT_05670 [Agromyces archimandritae]